MKWITRDRMTTSGLYQIVQETRDYSIWLRKENRWSILIRGVPSLDTAKIFVASHQSDHATPSA